MMEKSRTPMMTAAERDRLARRLDPLAGVEADLPPLAAGFEDSFRPGGAARVTFDTPPPVAESKGRTLKVRLV
jgi:hypothetical protein